MSLSMSSQSASGSTVETATASFWESESYDEVIEFAEKCNCLNTCMIYLLLLLFYASDLKSASQYPVVELKRAKLIALIKKESFEAAVEFYEENTATFNLLADCAFCKAYALYRLGNLNESSSCLDAISSSLPIIKLQAQICYKMNKIDAANAIYQKLVTFNREDTELLTNALACVGSPNDFANIEKPPIQTQSSKECSFELLFNLGTAALTCGRFEDALAFLKRSLDCAINAKLSESDIKNARLQLAIACCADPKTSQGVRNEALLQLRDVALQSMTCPLAIVALNNYCVFSTNSASPELLSQLKKSSKSELFAKLTARQQLLILKNLFILTQSMSWVREICSKPSLCDALSLLQDSFSTFLLKAHVFLRKGDNEAAKTAALKAVQSYTIESPILAFGLMIRLQLIEEALKIVKNSPETFQKDMIALLFDINADIINSILPKLAQAVCSDAQIYLAYRLHVSGKKELSDSLLKAAISSKTPFFDSSLVSSIKSKSKKHKSHKKNKLPKRPSLKIDPERWKPRRDRSNAKKLKKKVSSANAK